MDTLKLSAEVYDMKSIARLIRRNFAVRWWIWSTQVERRKSSPKSLSRQHSQSPNGFGKQTGMLADASMARPVPSARNCPSFAARIAVCAREHYILAKHIPDMDPGAASWFARGC